jgi:hypothetical protein
VADHELLPFLLGKPARPSGDRAGYSVKGITRDDVIAFHAQEITPTTRSSQWWA